MLTTHCEITFLNCCKFNVGKISLCYVDYDPCEMFLGITHKVKLDWQLIIVLYYGHMQGAFKSSLNFITYFKLLRLLKNQCYSYEGKFSKNNFLQCLKIKLLSYSQKGFPTTIWVKAYLGGTTKNHPPQNYRIFLGLKHL